MRLGSWLLPFVLLLLGTVPAAAAGDYEKYCDPTAANIIVYLDRTTPYDEIDKAALIDGVSRVFEGLTGGERFVLRTINDASVRSESLIDSCIPVCKSSGWLDDLFGGTCTEGVMLNDRKHLRTKVVGQMQSLLDGFVELPYSDIVLTVAKTGSAEYREDRPNRYYLFTDLIENSQNIPGKDFFSVKNDKLIAKLEAQGQLATLTGADIRVFGVGRSGKPGRPPLDPALLAKLTQFWTAYFEAAGAKLSIQQSLGAID
jgi:hypothetical protein